MTRRYRFWSWAHDRLEGLRHWIYVKKIRPYRSSSVEFVELVIGLDSAREQKYNSQREWRH